MSETFDEKDRLEDIGRALLADPAVQAEILDRIAAMSSIDGQPWVLGILSEMGQAAGPFGAIASDLRSRALDEMARLQGRASV